MTFFYDLNKKLDSIREKPELTHKQLNERDEGKPGKNFAKIAKDAGERYGSKAAGERVAGAVRNKLKAQGKLEERDQDFGPGRSGPNKNLPGPEYSFSPDTLNYKTPNLDKGRELDRDPHIAAWNKEKVNTTMGPDTRGNQAEIGASQLDAQGQMKYVNRTAPGVINKIKDKLGYDMPDPAYGPRPDETQRLAKRYPAPVKEADVEESAFQAAIGKKKYGEPGMRALQDAGRRGDSEAKKQKIRDKFDRYDESMEESGGPVKQASPGFGKDYKPLVPDTEKPGSARGTIKGGTFQADPKGRVKPPSGDPEGVKEANKAMTPKQRSFAALAPPKNKITFADKMAAEAMRKAVGGGRGRNAEMDEEKSKGTAFDMSTPREVKPKVGSVERGHKHDIKHTATGRVVTRRTDDQGHSVGADDETDADGAPRGRGRPKGTKNVSSKAKVFQRKSKLMTKEGDMNVTDQGEYDQEGEMAKDDIKTIVRHAQALQKVLGDNDNLPEWVQAKLAKIEGMMTAVDDYMQNQASDDGEEPIAEKAVSKQQQKFMGMAHAMQKGEKIPGASKELKKVAKTMKPKDVEDFAATKHKGLPQKAKSKKKDVEEGDDGKLKTTVNADGSKSTSSSTGRISATIDQGKVSVKPAKSGDLNFGKGIYDSMNRELENMIAESMSVNMSDSTEGGKSLTITATDEDAMKLAMMLKAAGLGGGGGDMPGHGAEPCETCGSMDCGCGDVQEAVDENAPDWPTNTETSSDALQYAGGLNKPKTDVAGDGQTTIPNTAVHTQDEDALRRMMEMAGLAEAKPDFLDLDKDGNKKESMKDAAKDKEEDIEESIRRMKEMAGIQREDHIDLGPISPEVAAMSRDEVNAALRSDMSPDISDMDPDEVNAQFGSDDDKQYEESIQRMREIAGIREAKKPDYLDFDKDGDKKEPMTKALKDKEEKKVDESIFTLTNQWRAYKG
jgi:hypothetical protein